MEGGREGGDINEFANTTYLISPSEAAAEARRRKGRRPADGAADLLILPPLKDKRLEEGAERAEEVGKEEEEEQEEAEAQEGSRGTKPSTAIASRKGRSNNDMRLLLAIVFLLYLLLILVFVLVTGSGGRRKGWGGHLRRTFGEGEVGKEGRLLVHRGEAWVLRDVPVVVVVVVG